MKTDLTVDVSRGAQLIIVVTWFNSISNDWLTWSWIRYLHVYISSYFIALRFLLRSYAVSYIVVLCSIPMSGHSTFCIISMCVYIIVTSDISRSIKIYRLLCHFKYQRSAVSPVIQGHITLRNMTDTLSINPVYLCISVDLFDCPEVCMVCVFAITYCKEVV